jgi:F-type H+-transporting ATPase subunit b
MTSQASKLLCKVRFPAAVGALLTAASNAYASGGHSPTPKQLRDLYLIQLVGFLLLGYIIYKFVFPILGRLLRERRHNIAGSFADAEQARTKEQEAHKAATNELLRFGDTEVQAIQQAVAEGTALRDTLITEAGVTVAKLEHKAKIEVEVENAKANLECQNHYTDIAFEAVREFVAGAVDRPTQNALVESFLNDLDKVEV